MPTGACSERCGAGPCAAGGSTSPGRAASSRGRPRRGAPWPGGALPVERREEPAAALRARAVHPPELPERPAQAEPEFPVGGATPLAGGAQVVGPEGGDARVRGGAAQVRLGGLGQRQVVARQSASCSPLGCRRSTADSRAVAQAAKCPPPPSASGQALSLKGWPRCQNPGGYRGRRLGPGAGKILKREVRDAYWAGQVRRGNQASRARGPRRARGFQRRPPQAAASGSRVQVTPPLTVWNRLPGPTAHPVLALMKSICSAGAGRSTVQWMPPSEVP